MTTTSDSGKSDLLYPELSYQIVGACYDAYNGLGYGFQEKQYQRAIALALTKRDITFQRELYVPIRFEGKIVGRYYLDFLVAESVAVELKIANEVYDTHVAQLLGYLRATSTHLGLLVHFTQQGVKVKRLVV